jgi:hypothetical protein
MSNLGIIFNGLGPDIRSKPDSKDRNGLYMRRFFNLLSSPKSKSELNGRSNSLFSDVTIIQA